MTAEGRELGGKLTGYYSPVRKKTSQIAFLKMNPSSANVGRESLTAELTKVEKDSVKRANNLATSKQEKTQIKAFVYKMASSSSETIDLPGC